MGVLAEYLQDEENIGRIWSSLSPFEKEYIDEFLKYEERPAYKKLESIYLKYGIKGSYIRDPWQEQSNMGLFFIGKSVPPQIKRALKKYLTPISRFVLSEEVYNRLAGGTVKGWADLVGILFQPPCECEHDVFWDDDYQGGSIKTWLYKQT